MTAPLHTQDQAETRQTLSPAQRREAERQVRIVRYVLIFVGLMLLIPLGIGLFG